MSNSVTHQERRRLRSREKARQGRVKRNGHGSHHIGGMIAGRPTPQNPLEQGSLVAALLAVRGFFGRRKVNGN